MKSYFSRIFVFFLMSIASLGAYAAGNASEIKKIQKNRAEYIFAESTDVSEDQAYSNALRQMLDMCRNFVEANTPGKTITDGAIEAALSKYSIPRNNFTRVFLYVRRDDLVGTAGNNADSAKPVPKPEIIEPVTPQNQESVSEPTEAVNEPSVLVSQKEIESPVAESESDAPESDQEFAESVPQDTKFEIDRKSNLSGAMQRLMADLHNAKGLKEAAGILANYKDMRLGVASYGSPKEARNTAACYWVVEDNGVISVLGPEVRGYRKNYRTNHPDALYRYSRGLWFRKR